ncbi:MFS transporter [Mesobacterium pallidum]|uniref:MFS transporter n=1 Tax=Mesobacterium pallidum TaxID=2872037 RepID=UPI001EE34591|nr:MFS transporter [Mesobacterium pallidum]
MAEITARKRIWGWYFFDWASQPYHTVLMTFIFGPYFAGVAAEYFLGTGLEENLADARAQTMWSWMQALAGLTIALGAPIMGALADTTGRVRPWMAFFSLLYVTGATLLWFTFPDGSNMWTMLVVFAVGFIGAEYALIFINSQLPSLGDEKTVGDISGSGFAFGYIGGLFALAIMLVFFAEQGSGKTLAGLDPIFGLDADQREGTRAVGPFVALWYIVFMVPYFLWVRDTGHKGRATIAGAFRKLGSTLRGIKGRGSLINFLLGSMLYRDALNGLYAFGGIYATLVLDWEVTQIGVFGVISGLGAAAFSYVGGKADRAFGPKPVVMTAVVTLILVCIVIVNLSRAAIFGVPLAEGSQLPDVIFIVCGVFIGGMGGTMQAASRSLMVRHTDPANPAEYFGLYGLSGRATAFIAPALVGLFTTLSGNVRIGVSPLIALFLVGLVLLALVKPQGERIGGSGQ